MKSICNCLQLDDKFDLPMFENERERMIIKVIKHIERNIYKLTIRMKK